jgi:hypothetical protein
VHSRFACFVCFARTKRAGRAAFVLSAGGKALATVCQARAGACALRAGRALRSVRAAAPRLCCRPAARRSPPSARLAVVHSRCACSACRACDRAVFVLVAVCAFLCEARRCVSDCVCARVTGAQPRATKPSPTPPPNRTNRLPPPPFPIIQTNNRSPRSCRRSTPSSRWPSGSRPSPTPPAPRSPRRARRRAARRRTHECAAAQRAQHQQTRAPPTKRPRPPPNPDLPRRGPGGQGQGALPPEDARRRAVCQLCAPAGQGPAARGRRQRRRCAAAGRVCLRGRGRRTRRMCLSGAGPLLKPPGLTRHVAPLPLPHAPPPRHAAERRG